MWHIRAWFVLCIPKGKSQSMTGIETPHKYFKRFVGNHIIVGGIECCNECFSTTIIPYYFTLKDKAFFQAEPKTNLPPQDESSKPKSCKESLHDSNQKEKVTKARLRHTSINFIALSWCCEFLNNARLSIVHEEASHARASNRGGQTGHKALLPEKRHHKGRVQRDFAESRSEGKFTFVVVFQHPLPCMLFTTEVITCERHICICKCNFLSLHSNGPFYSMNYESIMWKWPHLYLVCPSHKVCHSKSGEINPVKVANLVKAYVDKYKHARKHKKEETGQSQQADV